MQDRVVVSDYDALPYDGVPIPQTHPDYLAALAALAGFDTPDPPRARILELGCAEGRNLLPIAFYWPQTECVGVEHSRVQAEAGQRLTRATGVSNCRIVHGDLSALPADLGRFDYIIAHGVYSWVPPAVQEALLRACADHLAPQGVAYVSFNALPGWASRQALRGTLMRAAAGLVSPAGRVEAARRSLELLAQRFGESELASYPDLAAEIAFLLQASPSYLFHEYLATHNSPETVARFRQRAASRGLTLLCDAGPGLCAGAWMGEAVEAGPSVRFCRALLIRAEAPRCATAALDALTFHADLCSDEEIDLAAATRQSFVGPTGQRIAVGQPRSKAALTILGTSCPSSLAWRRLMAAAGDLLDRYGTPQEESDRDFVEEWMGLVSTQAVWPGRVERHVSATRGIHPRASALARAEAAAGTRVAGLRHRALDLDPAAGHLVALLDGSRNLGTLVHDMQAFLAAQHKFADEPELRDAISGYVALFARNGLLV